MIKNLSPDSRFQETLSILSFEDTQKVQFESYCRANYYQVIWIKKGEAVFEVDMKKISLTSGQFICIGKDLVYKFDSENEYTGYVLSFAEHYFDRCEREKLFLQDARIFKDQSQPMSAAEMMLDGNLLSVESILNTYLNDTDPLSDDIIHTLLKFFLFRAEAALTKNSPPVSISDTNKILVNNFRKLVNEHFIEHKDLVFYTERLGVSSRQLLYATKQAVGKNAKEIIIEKVIVEGKRFLTYSGLSVKQIAYRLGFNEPNNFSIFFNKYTGMTPLAFKKNILDSSSGKAKKIMFSGHS
ncbi:MAG: helix-turn-helix transcriptional regulator [Dysgonamonadaceae bacterium]|jgi:AraC-like DNA-binding protein|nr:helix-turn-helix transcriptional regulator [Dysgonamonadaceae bacterium]